MLNKKEYFFNKLHRYTGKLKHLFKRKVYEKMLDNFGYEDILRTKNNVRKTISGLYCTRVDKRSRLYEISCPFFKSRTFVVVASCSTFILRCFKEIVIYLERLDDPTVKSSFCSWSGHQIFVFGCSKVVSTCSKRNTFYI